MMSKNLPLAQVNLSGEARQIDGLEGYKAYRIFEAALTFKYIIKLN